MRMYSVALSITFSGDDIMRNSVRDRPKPSPPDRKPPSSAIKMAVCVVLLRFASSFAP